MITYIPVISVYYKDFISFGSGEYIRLSFPGTQSYEHSYYLSSVILSQGSRSVNITFNGRTSIIVRFNDVLSDYCLLNINTTDTIIVQFSVTGIFPVMSQETIYAAIAPFDTPIIHGDQVDQEEQNASGINIYVPPTGAGTFVPVTTSFADGIPDCWSYAIYDSEKANITVDDGLNLNFSAETTYVDGIVFSSRNFSVPTYPFNLYYDDLTHPYIFGLIDGNFTLDIVVTVPTADIKAGFRYYVGGINLLSAEDLPVGARIIFERTDQAGDYVYKISSVVRDDEHDIWLTGYAYIDTATATLRIQKIGSTFFCFYNIGEGFVLLVSSAVGPYVVDGLAITFGLFSYNGTDSIKVHSITLDPPGAARYEAEGDYTSPVLVYGEAGYGLLTLPLLSIFGSGSQLVGDAIGQSNLPVIYLSAYQSDNERLDETLPVLSCVGSLRYVYTEISLPAFICGGGEDYAWGDISFPAITAVVTATYAYGMMFLWLNELEGLSFIQGSPSSISNSLKPTILLKDHPDIVELSEALFWGM